MSRLPKLVEFFNASLSEKGSSSALSAVRVHAWYTPATLSRLLASRQGTVRMSAAWALGLIGHEIHLETLGTLLRDPIRGVRSASDEARRSILSRTQSPWHRHCVAKIEDLIASSELSSAASLADHLIEETDPRADVYLLRGWIRFCNLQWDLAILDCKQALHVDPYCYRACVALGQCYWHQNLNAAARECFMESVRVYPDWEPAHTALRMMDDSRETA